MSKLTEMIQTYRDQGQSRDAIYEHVVEEYGLYGVAFFGHRGTRNQRRRLQYAWQRIMKLVPIDNHNTI